MAKRVVLGETSLFFFFFQVSVKLGPKMVVSRVFWSKNLKPVVVSLKPGGFWWSWRPYTWLGPRAGAERVFQCFF